MFYVFIANAYILGFHFTPAFYHSSSGLHDARKSHVTFEKFLEILGCPKYYVALEKKVQL